MTAKYVEHNQSVSNVLCFIHCKH